MLHPFLSLKFESRFNKDFEEMLVTILGKKGEFFGMAKESKELIAKYLSKLLKDIYIWNEIKTKNKKSDENYDDNSPEKTIQRRREKEDEFMKKISHNEYFNIRGLIPMLLPHIEYEKENIKTLNDIYTKKTAEFTDPDTEAVEYVHSNIQYSRCKKRTKYSKTQADTLG